MYTRSTQKKYWMFPDESDLIAMREKVNADFIEKHGKDTSDEEKKKFFLSTQEEYLLMRFFEGRLKDFAKNFTPAMPRSTIATAFHYFKRFYLRKSIMDYHPKEILVTCLYLACKVEEFNVSISQFVANIKGDRDKASDIILNNELLLMYQLDYHLTVHNPYRPVEGILIDIKTRFPGIENPENLRPHIDEFLETIFLTDSVLLYAPSQIALAAVFHAASKVSTNLDQYVTDILFSREHLPVIIEAVRKIRSIYKSYEAPPRDVSTVLIKKLDKCRNQENNPDSQIYKQKLEDLLDEEDLMDNEKYAQIVKQQADRDSKILGVTRVVSPGAD